MRIHPIRTEADHDAAVARIAELMGAKPNTAEGEELDILATLVDAYEAKHHVIDAPDPIAAIQFRMEQQELTRKNLEPLIGSRARVSEVMTRRRPLTLAMIRRIRDGLGISADVLVGDPENRRHKRVRLGKLPSKTKVRRGSGAVSRSAAVLSPK
jgi:HTH-type transcriptional regulator/antitoxin HigA